VILFPIATLSAIVLFLYSDLCLATSINFVFSNNGQTLSIGPALAFSVVICAINAYWAGAYLIAFCIGFMSILWPFIKLVLLLFAWIAPQNALNPRVRGMLLRFLDEYGKWSLIDTWLGILALACYRLGWQSSKTDAHFYVDPVPNMPFFMFVLSSVLTLILGHVASGYHRRAEETHELEEGNCELRSPLCAHSTGFTGAMITLGTPCIAVLIVVSAITPCFEMVESGALATLMLEPENRVNKFSLVDLGLQMTRGRQGDVGLHLVQAIFFVFSLAIPIALLLLFLVLWLLPLSHSSQNTLMEVCQAMDAWAAFDVFAVAVTVSHFEFGLFSTFLMHYNNLQQGCRLVTGYLRTECFHMECSLTPGFGLLAVAGLLSYAAPKLALGACRSALQERQERDASCLESSSDEADSMLSSTLSSRRTLHA